MIWLISLTIRDLLITQLVLSFEDVDKDGGVAVDVTVEDGLCEDIDQFLLHKPFDRTGSVFGELLLRSPSRSQR